MNGNLIFSFYILKSDKFEILVGENAVDAWAAGLGESGSQLPFKREL